MSLENKISCSLAALVCTLFRVSTIFMFMYQSDPLCTGYSLLLISNNCYCCDLNLLHWVGGTVWSETFTALCSLTLPQS